MAVRYVDPEPRPLRAIERRPGETIDEAIVRLAVVARERGITIIVRDGRYFATSYTQPHKLHFVTLLSCDCRGFAHHGRCTHHSALLEALGQLPHIDRLPAGCVKVRCRHCHGAGRNLRVRARPEDQGACPACRGTGREVSTAGYTPSGPGDVGKPGFRVIK